MKLAVIKSVNTKQLEAQNKLVKQQQLEQKRQDEIINKITSKKLKYYYNEYRIIDKQQLNKMTQKEVEQEKN